METLEFLRRLIAASHRQIDASMKDTTAEQFNWVPAGTANPISATYIHCLNSEDFFVQAVLQGKPRLWEEFKHMHVEIGPLNYETTFLYSKTAGF